MSLEGPAALPHQSYDGELSSIDRLTPVLLASSPGTASRLWSITLLQCPTKRRATRPGAAVGISPKHASSARRWCRCPAILILPTNRSRMSSRLSRHGPGRAEASRERPPRQCGHLAGTNVAGAPANPAASIAPSCQGLVGYLSSKTRPIPAVRQAGRNCNRSVRPVGAVFSVATSVPNSPDRGRRIRSGPQPTARYHADFTRSSCGTSHPYNSAIAASLRAKCFFRMET